MPKVSIIMGVYNDSKSLEASIQSLLNQSFQDFEFIICDDASTDETPKLLEKYRAHPQIILLRNEKNMGLAETLNRCLAVAKGEYIARQDSDDRSLPERLERQLAYLKAHPEIDVLGTYATIVDDEGREWGRFERPLYPTIHDWVRLPAVVHPTLIIKKEIFEKYGSYDPTALRVEDYELWLRWFTQGVRFANMPESLYLYRLSSRDYAKKKFKYRLTEALYRLRAYRLMKAPLCSYVQVLRPIIAGLLPNCLFESFQRRKRVLK